GGVSASAVGAGTASGAEAADALTRFLNTNEVLLILDNCEHLVAAVARLASTIVRAAGTSRVLVTSREALGIDGERIWQAKPLEVPASELLDDIASCDAVRLFVDRAWAARRDFAFTDTNAQLVSSICRRL